MNPHAALQDACPARGAGEGRQHSAGDQVLEEPCFCRHCNARLNSAHAGDVGFPEACIQSSGLVQPLLCPVTKCCKVQTHQAGRASFWGWVDASYQ